ncbi:hypothetical protein [Bacillus sp. REN16]|uniref:hypothetical protein n=1 Tax=Bacillus sp. REN16 TaxID=2887296 RepID=UPI001E5ABE43|nr:hypothetical protein [Bacillus sp. REN16]MCC3357044.1 hypothetical protein [Bacillus sp. REN16]
MYRWKRARFAVILLCVITLTACAPKSGKKNIEITLGDLEHEFMEEFEFIEVVGVNKEGYDVLLVAPKSNPDIQFHAYLFQGDAGGLPVIGMNNNYMDVAFLHYAPELYKKHFGILIDKEKAINDYYAFTEESNFSNIWDFNKYLETTNFVIKDINQENMEEMSGKMAGALVDFLNIHPFSMRKVDGGSAYDVFRAMIPYEFTGENFNEGNLYNSIYTSAVINETNPQQAVYEVLLLHKERREELRNNESE